MIKSLGFNFSNLDTWFHCTTLFYRNYLNSNALSQPLNAPQKPFEKNLLIKKALCDFKLPHYDTPLHITSNSVALLSKIGCYTHITLAHNNHSVSPSILLHQPSGYTLIHLSLSFNPSRSEINALALAYFIGSQLGLSIKHCTLYCLHPHFIKGTDKPLFKKMDMKKRVHSLSKKINTASQSLSSCTTLPYTALDKPCFKPSVCPYLSTCFNTNTSWDIFTLISMPIHEKIQWYKKGIRSFQDILTHSIPLTPSQKNQCWVEINQTPYINTDAVSVCLSQLTSHYQCFDIESAQFAYPLYDGQKPFELFPFLYSIHRLSHPDSPPVHTDAFWKPHHDFRREFTMQLIQDLDTSCSILIFDAALEKKVLQYLATCFPEFSDALARIHHQIIDIAPLFINHHIILPGMKGKASLKHVLASIPSSQCYSSLDVQSGFDVVETYSQYCFDSDCDHQAIETQLRSYCKQDTQALVDIMHSGILTGIGGVASKK